MTDNVEFDNESNLGEVVRFLDNTSGEMGAALLRGLKSVVAAIEVNAARGVGLDGKFKKRYTEKYAKLKAATKRDSGIVDLTFTGAMLRSIQGKVDKRGADTVGIIFSSNTKDAGKIDGNHKIRPFFGLNKQYEELILTELDKVISRNL